MLSNMINFNTDYWHQNYTRQFWRAIIIGLMWYIAINAVVLTASFIPNSHLTIRYTMPIISLLAWLAMSWIDYGGSDIRISTYRMKNNLCIDCGYNVKSIMDIEKRCPECGRGIARSYWDLPFVYEPL